MRVLDLFCGAGLVAAGLIDAGCEVVGVDLHPQPDYPAPFLLHDATTLDPRFIAMFDWLWASPPCLRDTVMRHAPGAKGGQHPDLITPTRAMLQRSGKPYVLENVMGAPLLDPVVLNGFMFGLGATTSDGRRFHLERKRQFETNWPLTAPPFQRQAPVIGVYGGHVRCRSASAGGRGTRDFVGEDKPALMRQAMGLDRRLPMGAISQGIPPAYATHIAVQMRRYLTSLRLAA